MIGRLAVRSLTAHPIRSAVLAAGFGVGVSVMAILLGVAEVVLDQARSPSLVGGGDVVLRIGPQVPARLVLSGTLQADALRDRVLVAAPWHTSDLFLVKNDGTTAALSVRGGIPSLERALGDPETDTAGWQDTAADAAWTRVSPAESLRLIDAFHPVPDAPEWADSWAEWLYFNGRAGGAQFYLTFMVGPPDADGLRPAGVRLQLDRGGRMESYSASAKLTQADVDRAPELSIAGNHVRLDGLRYIVELDLAGRGGVRAAGTVTIDAEPGRLLPPIQISGARGWLTGYVVPVMSGRLGGALRVGGAIVSFAGGTGYHDHNWGFWRGVSWQWGQVQHGGRSFLYGRVFPPPEAADAERLPGFLGVLGPDGPQGFATNVRITEQNDARGLPQAILVRGRGPTVDITLHFDVQSREVTRMPEGPLANNVDFLQMRGTYTVSGRAGDERVDFTAPGSAETFRSTEGAHPGARAPVPEALRREPRR
ncbi:MAG: hypothetical protein AB1635_00080 [Acidobacteriota bacterium]